MWLFTNGTKYRQYISNRISRKDELILTNFESGWRLRREKWPTKATGPSRHFLRWVFLRTSYSKDLDPDCHLMRSLKLPETCWETTNFRPNWRRGCSGLTAKHRWHLARTTATGRMSAPRPTFRHCLNSAHRRVQLADDGKGMIANWPWVKERDREKVERRERFGLPRVWA